ncbi:MAG: hypothetical protein ABR548_02820 [Actinomycetota bacterium]|nr:hypothetical protein [Actinomycetota bacterium]
MTRRLALAIVLLLATVACSGPRSPLDVGVREIDTDVLIGPGRPTVVAFPPLAPAPGPIGFPGFVQPPIITGPKPPSPPACPAADPLAPIAHEATTSATKPPVAGTYPYLVKGFNKIGDATNLVSETTSRTVANVVKAASGGGFTFDIVIPQPGGARTTTTYHVYPNQPEATDTTPGIYIERVETKVPGADPLTFNPTPPLLLMQFPASANLTWTSRSVDPFSGTVEQFTGTIGNRQIIDACGTKIQTWRVDITDGSIQNPFESFTFEGTIYITPQFGGLSVRDNIHRKGTQKKDVTDSGTTVESQLDARIAHSPRFP